MLEIEHCLTFRYMLYSDSDRSACMGNFGHDYDAYRTALGKQWSGGVGMSGLCRLFTTWADIVVCRPEPIVTRKEESRTPDALCCLIATWIYGLYIATFIPSMEI
jgi:hypothetical protein